MSVLEPFTEQICVIGLGHVGVVTCAWLAQRGHHVVGIDVDPGRVESLREGRLPLYEPGLHDLVAAGLRTGRLAFTTDPETGVREAAIVFLTVGTPPGPDGSVDLAQVETAVEAVAGSLQPGAILVMKSTAPPGTAGRITGQIRRIRGGAFPCAVVSNPEFLQEGRALETMGRADRIVVGGSDPEAVRRVAALYQGIGPILVTDHVTAEMIKYASNAALATRVSFANEMAKLCDALGVDFLQVARGVGMDRRIGPDFLIPGPGFGGSCFPKDVAALIALGQRAGVEMILLKEVLRVNHRQPRFVFNKLRREMGTVRGKIVALLGLSFKANTDDVRESPALDLARILLSEGATVRAYDPVAEPKSQVVLPAVHYFADPYEPVTGADGAVICTEWEEFSQLDLARVKALMAAPLVIDARNIIARDRALAAGLRYRGLGRGDGGA